MSYLLNLVYLTLLVALSPWLLLSAIRKGKYRQGWAAKLWGTVPTRRSDRPCVWLHAVSVGEVNLLQPLLVELERRFPEVECVISTTTRTGFELARKKYAPRTVFYCPLDFSWAVSRALRRLQPTLLVLAELELWPNLIRLAHRRGVKLAVINGRLGEQSYRGYRRLRWVMAPLLARIDAIAVQTTTYRDRFLGLGAAADRVHVTGSLKFDGAQTNRQNPATTSLATLAAIQSDDVVLLAGSTQEPEEQIVLRAYQSLCGEFPQLRLIVVPRHPERFEAVAQLIDRSGLDWRRRSRLNGQPVDAESRVLLVDAVGELGAWWGTAQIAFVGGSLGQRGGQNMIEPAAYGAAVAFGPNTWNFRDVVTAMLDADAAVVVDDESSLTAFIRRCLTDPAFADQLGRRAQHLVTTQLGATDRTMQLLAPLVPSTSNS